MSKLKLLAARATLKLPDPLKVMVPLPRLPKPPLFPICKMPALKPTLPVQLALFWVILSVPPPDLVKPPAPESVPLKMASVVVAIAAVLAKRMGALIVTVGFTVPVVVKFMVGATEPELVSNSSWLPWIVTVGAVPLAGPA